MLTRTRIFLASGALFLAATSVAQAQPKAGAKTTKKKAAVKPAAPAKAPRVGGTKAELQRIEAELAQMRQVLAATPTITQAVQELSNRMVQVESGLSREERLAGSVPELIEAVGELRAEHRRLSQDLEYLRTQLADVEQPSVSSGGSASHQGGMSFATADGDYTLLLGGFLQTQYTLSSSDGLSSLDENGFSIARARLQMGGKLGSERLTYLMDAELGALQDTPLVDYFMNMKYRESLQVRVGQAKVPFSRSFLAPSRDRIFFELAEGQERLRYDRDIGVWVHGSFRRGDLRYQAGASNGAGPNASNDNIDFALVSRVEAALLGDYIAPGFADVERTPKPALTVGGAVLHDLVAMPESFYGLEVGNRDVENVGRIDNIRAMSATLDAQFRLKGFELFVEGTYRQERWGFSLEQDDNADLAAVIQASDKGHRNYLSMTAQASYFVWRDRLLVASRVSHGRLPWLTVGGPERGVAPLAQRALVWDSSVNLYRDGMRRVGLSYSLINFNEKNAPDPVNDIVHRFLLQAQLVL